mgnify:CR=1 FL=1
MFQITEAVREQLIGAIAFTGPSGSGKTLSMLKTAKGMMDKKYGTSISEIDKWKKIGVIDTEHKRSLIYAQTSGFNVTIDTFLHLDFQKPYTVDRLDQAIKALKDHGCEVIIIDSLSHFWEGDGGLLDLQQQFGGTFQAWRDVNPYYNYFISLITGEKHQIDTLCGIRSKQAYEVSTTETGKLEVQKLGLKPVQRDSLEYEFQIVFGINMNHQAVALKDNSSIFQFPHQVETETGEKIYEWLKEGKDVIAEQNAKKEELIGIINEYKEHANESMSNYTKRLIKKAENTYSSLMSMPLNRLEDFVQNLRTKETQLPKGEDQ